MTIIVQVSLSLTSQFLMILSMLILSVVSAVGDEVSTTVGLIAMDVLLDIMNHHTLSLDKKVLDLFNL